MKFLKFLRDIVKSTINIENLMIQNKIHNILLTWTQMVYMVMECLNFFQPVNSNGLILKILI